LAGGATYPEPMAHRSPGELTPRIPQRTRCDAATAVVGPPL